MNARVVIGVYYLTLWVPMKSFVKRIFLVLKHGILFFSESKRFGSLSTNSSQSQSSVEKSPAPSTRSLNVCSSCPSSRTNSSEDDQVEGDWLTLFFMG